MKIIAHMQRYAFFSAMMTLSVHADFAPVIDGISSAQEQLIVADASTIAPTAEISETQPTDTVAQETSSPITARLTIKINELQAQQMSLMGKLEAIEHLLETLVTEQKATKAALSQLTLASPQVQPSLPKEAPTPASSGNTPAAAQGPVQAQADTTQPASQKPATAEEVVLVDIRHDTPENAYEKARRLIPRGKYALAEKALTEFLTKHEGHALAPAAIYWLGETHFVRGNFTAAAKHFLEGYKKSPQGTKAPDLLLKLGISLARLGKTTEACATFRKLRTDFPTLSPTIQVTLARENETLKCPSSV